MPNGGVGRFGDDERIAGIKIISGWCIEARRKRDSVAQIRLAKLVGVAVRWLREIEAGNPKATLDDHLRCASALGLSVGYIVIPMLCEEHGRRVPREMLLYELAPVERRCLDAITATQLDAFSAFDHGR